MIFRGGIIRIIRDVTCIILFPFIISTFNHLFKKIFFQAKVYKVSLYIYYIKIKCQTFYYWLKTYPLWTASTFPRIFFYKSFKPLYKTKFSFYLSLFWRERIISKYMPIFMKIDSDLHYITFNLHKYQCNSSWFSSNRPEIYLMIEKCQSFGCNPHSISRFVLD